MKPKIAIPEPCSYDRSYSDRALSPYIEAVQDVGGEAVVISLEWHPDEIARRINECAAVLLTGSKADVDPQKYGAPRHEKTAPADPLRDTADELLLQDAYNMRKPILGICYGLQTLNVWRTGTLIQHIDSKLEHDPKNKDGIAHQVTIEDDSFLAREIGQVQGRNLLAVNSSHHQAAKEPGDALRVAARCLEDGVIEALEGTDPAHYVLAVQWHPEKDFKHDVPSRRLFQSLVRAAQDWDNSYRKSLGG
ncbi:MAG TPA: gamma-glutamyl-gamma-aminobutyrate hydrolase family protein [Candidatus Angelobacter sp.]|nr:gamma-glutamyl-gamma-aminobutyrate hydrolase family protein [Candidatus Angelobacter sp.]